MDLVTETEEGLWQISYTWLPTWMGFNKALMVELQRHLASKFGGAPTDRHLQDKVNKEAASWLQSRFPHIQGLEEHLLHLQTVSVQ